VGEFGGRGDVRPAHQLLAGDHYALGGSGQFRVASQRAVDLAVALLVGAPNMDQRHVGIDGPHGQKALARERTRDRPVAARTHLGQLRAAEFCHREERDIVCASIEGDIERDATDLVDLQ